jgi:hypothetical protein
MGKCQNSALELQRNCNKHSFNNNSKRSSFEQLSREVCGGIKEPEKKTIHETGRPLCNKPTNWILLLLLLLLLQEDYYLMRENAFRFSLKLCSSSEPEAK